MKEDGQQPVGAREDTIAAISTSMGEAGIGIVRMSGPDAFFITEKLFEPVDHRSYEPSLNRRLRYGWITDGQKRVDEVLVSFMKGPHTYTAEDITEINAHGGRVSVSRILALALASGARMAEPGEFTRRAFLNGRIDLTQAEAVIDIIDADTEQAQQQAVDQLSGVLSRSLGSLRHELLDLLSQMEYAINFQEDAQEDLPLDPMLQDGDHILDSMRQLLKESKNGRLIREGVATAIVGKPNVGKSSLLNAFLDQERAIVTDIPGTTRDAIEESYQLGGMALRLIDTAGIRETSDVVESIGVDISRQHLENADLVLILLDGSADYSEEDEQLLRQASQKTSIVLLNKEDLPLNLSMKKAKKRWMERTPSMPWVSISAKEGTGLSDLKETILSMLFEEQPKENVAVLSNIRHIDLLKKAERSLFSGLEALRLGMTLDAAEVDFRDAYAKLCEITGQSIGDDVLDTIFSRFCVGK